MEDIDAAAFEARNRVRPVAYVKFRDAVKRTDVARGRAPQWKQTLSIWLGDGEKESMSPAEMMASKEEILISVFDEVRG